MIKSGRFLGRHLRPLLKTGISLLKNIIEPLARSVLIPFELTAASLAADAGIHKKILDSGKASPIISNNKMKAIMKIVKSLEDSGLLSKGVSKTIQNEEKEKKEDFLVCY